MKSNARGILKVSSAWVYLAEQFKVNQQGGNWERQMSMLDARSILTNLLKELEVKL